MHNNLKIHRKNHRYSYEKICQTVSQTKERSVSTNQSMYMGGERLVQGLGYSPGRKSICLCISSMFLTLKRGEKVCVLGGQHEKNIESI